MKTFTITLIMIIVTWLGYWITSFISGYIYNYKAMVVIYSFAVLLWLFIFVVVFNAIIDLDN